MIYITIEHGKAELINEENPATIYFNQHLGSKWTIILHYYYAERSQFWTVFTIVFWGNGAQMLEKFVTGRLPVGVHFVNCIELSGNVKCDVKTK